VSLFTNIKITTNKVIFSMEQTRETFYILCNIQVCSWNHCSSRKAISTVFAHVICAPAYFAHPNFYGMILDLFLLPVFTMFSLIIGYWIDNGIYSAIVMVIINVIIDKSRLVYKMTIKYWLNLLYSQLY
jgi:hypothetical protein